MATTVTPIAEELAAPTARRGLANASDLGDAVRAAEYASRAIADPNRANPELARPLAEQSAGARHVAARMDQYEAVLQAGITASEARETFSRARDAVSDGVHHTRVAQGAERELGGALAKLYIDPAAARRELDTAIRQVGLDKTSEMLLRTPAVFGEVTASWKAQEARDHHGRQPARPDTLHAIMLLDRAEGRRAEAPTPEQMSQLLRTADRAEVAAVTAEAALARAPSGDALARSIARGVARLDDRAFGELKAALPVARAELADTFREGTVQALARDSAGRIQHLREQVGERLGISTGVGAAATGTQLESAATLHERATRSLNDGRELARVLGPREASMAPEQAHGVRADPTSVGNARPDAALERGTAASPRERVMAADVAARAVHQAVQALTPEELQALVGAVRAGVEVVKAMGSAGVGGGALAAHQAVRAGVARVFTGPEVER